MKKILVTGATGFIGNRVINLLLSEGIQVVATSTDIGKAKNFDWFHQVDYKQFDLKDFDNNINYFSFFGSPDSMLHLAWEGLPNYKSSFHIQENLPRHSLFLKNLIQNGITDLSVTGTCLEYGLQEGCLSESMEANPIVAYAIAKNELRIELEKFCADDKRVSFKWLRLFYMYGEGQNPNSLFSQLEKAVQENKDVFNMSGGEQQRDFLPVEEMVYFLLKIVIQNKICGIINCCSGRHIKVKDLVKQYLALKGVKMKLNLGYYPYTDYEPMNFWGDNSKMNKITNYE